MRVLNFYYALVTVIFYYEFLPSLIIVTKPELLCALYSEVLETRKSRKTRVEVRIPNSKYKMARYYLYIIIFLNVIFANNQLKIKNCPCIVITHIDLYDLLENYTMRRRKSYGLI